MIKNKKINVFMKKILHNTCPGSEVNNMKQNIFRLYFSDVCIIGGARGVVVIVVGNGHGDTSSNPGRDWLHFT